MKFTVTKDQLMFGVRAVIRTVSPKSSMAILQGIHLAAAEGKLTFSATDLAMSTVCSVPAEVDEAGVAVVPAKLFADMAGKLPDGNIRIATADTDMTLTYNLFSEVALKCLPAEEFPSIENNVAETVTLPASTLKQVIRLTTFASADEDARPVFTGVYFDLADDVLNIVATDTHRLAYKRIGIPSTGVNKAVIVPSKAVDEVFRLLRDGDESVSIGIGESNVMFSFAGIRILTRLIDGQFPAYKQVIPASCKTTLEMSRKEFCEGLERAGLLMKGHNNVVTFNLGENGDRLSFLSKSESGKVSEQLAVANVQGEATKVAFNANYMVDLLKVLDSEQAVRELNGPTGPGIIKAKDDDSYLYLCLPVRAA